VIERLRRRRRRRRRRRGGRESPCAIDAADRGRGFEMLLGIKGEVDTSVNSNENTTWMMVLGNCLQYQTSQLVEPQLLALTRGRHQKANS
jgi:hypothetical protein